MFDTLTTEEKVLGGGVLLGLGLLAFVKPARNAVGLADRVKNKYGEYTFLGTGEGSNLKIGPIAAKNKTQAIKYGKQIAQNTIVNKYYTSRKVADEIINDMKLDAKLEKKRTGVTSKSNALIGQNLLFKYGVAEWKSKNWKNKK
jgi:hypothetical protein